VPAILSLSKSHVHLVAQFGELKIRTVVGRLKAAATRAIRQEALKTASTWAAGCHMKSLYQEADFTAAFRYVLEHRSEGAVLHRWDPNIEWTFDG